MTSLAPVAATRSSAPPARRVAWRHWRARNPESATVALAALAWVAMAVAHWSNHDSVGVVAPKGWSAFGTEVALWSLMTVAMMVPGTVGMVRRLALDSLLSRRQRSAALFTFTYVGAWAVVVVVLLAVERGAAFALPWLTLRSTPVVIATLLAAAVWQLSAAKARFLNGCHLRTPLAPRGWAADRSVLRYARMHARACIGSCWLLMAAMFVAGHDFHLMVPLAVVTTYERFVKRPNQHATAAALVTLAGAYALGLV